MTPEYIAGFFDGEGCINITISGKIKQTTLRLMLVNTNVDFMKRVQRMYGGRISVRPHKDKSWKDYCIIVWTGNEARRFIKIIEPHLILKRRQCQLALEFLEFMDGPRSKRCHTVLSPTTTMPYRVVLKRTPETLHKEMEFKNAMHSLNRKGSMLL